MHFPTPGDYLFVKMKNSIVLTFCGVVEASSFSLNHNMTLESKENYPRHTKIIQNSLGFMRK